MALRATNRDEQGLCRIVCESAAVVVAMHPADGPSHLKLTSERSGRSILLDAELLTLLTRLTPEMATELVRLRTEKEEYVE
jgi:hypothetical protein